MRCLWITRQDPRPSNSGELIYSCGLIRSLAGAGVDITVLAHQATANARASAAPLAVDERIRWELHGTIPTGRLRGMISSLPSDAYRLGNPVQRAALRRLMSEGGWDWVVIDHAAGAWALDEIPRSQRVAYVAHNDEATVRRDVAHDRDGSLPMQAALRWDAWKYGRMEHRLGDRASLVTAITPRDLATFRARHPGKATMLLMPGYGGAIPPGPAPRLTADLPRRVVLVGAFEWLAKRRNLEAFLREAAPPFTAAGVEFQVVGKAEPAWFAELAKRHPWARFDANVPLIDPYLAQARIGLIPEALGGGFKLKALDYVFRGLPLAAIGPALSGVPIDPVRDAVVGDDLTGLARAVVDRIDDLDFLNAAAGRALDACRHAFDWASRGRDLAVVLAGPPEDRGSSHHSLGSGGPPHRNFARPPTMNARVRWARVSS